MNYSSISYERLCLDRLAKIPRAFPADRLGTLLPAQRATIADEEVRYDTRALSFCLMTCPRAIPSDGGITSSSSCSSCSCLGHHPGGRARHVAVPSIDIDSHQRKCSVKSRIDHLGDVVLTVQAQTASFGEKLFRRYDLVII